MKKKIKRTRRTLETLRFITESIKHIDNAFRKTNREDLAVISLELKTMYTRIMEESANGDNITNREYKKYKEMRDKIISSV